MKIARSYLAALAATAVSVIVSQQAGATYHTFKFAEIYSNPSGTVQFIELHESLGATFQSFLSEAPDILSRNGATVEHDFTLTDLPSTATANTYFLLGTAGYNALPGAPHADFTIPNNFFNPAGDTLQYGSTGPDGIVDTITFSSLPGGNNGLFRTGTTGSTFTTAQAIANTFSSGGNFAVAVPEPTSVGVMAMAAVMTFVRRKRNQ